MEEVDFGLGKLTPEQMPAFRPSEDLQEQVEIFDRESSPSSRSSIQCVPAVQVHAVEQDLHIARGGTGASCFAEAANTVGAAPGAAPAATTNVRLDVFISICPTPEEGQFSESLLKAESCASDRFRRMAFACFNASPAAS
jgi:hypothetical protein